MKFNYIDIAIIALFSYPILMGFFSRYNANNQKKKISSIIGIISFIISIYGGNYIYKGIFVSRQNEMFKSIYNLLPKAFLITIKFKPYIPYLIVLPIIIFVVYMIIRLIFEIISYFTLDKIFELIEAISVNMNSIVRRILGVIFEIPRSLAYVLIFCYILNYSALFLQIRNIGVDYRDKIEQSIVYNKVNEKLLNPISNSNFAKELPSVVSNSFKIVENIGDKFNLKVVYYNGMTLEDAVKTNTQIDNFAKNLTKTRGSSYDKAKTIYNWITDNVQYDYDKAIMVMNNDFSKKSGAINTFDTKEGICLDYAALYVAMCRATEVKVRMVTGEGYNGEVWVSHAWNEIYSEEEKTWISVDPTFGTDRNYFDNDKFQSDHRGNKTVGEWK